MPCSRNAAISAAEIAMLGEDFVAVSAEGRRWAWGRQGQPFGPGDAVKPAAGSGTQDLTSRRSGLADLPSPGHRHHFGATRFTTDSVVEEG